MCKQERVKGHVTDEPSALEMAMKKFWIGLLCLAMDTCQAYDGWSSELTHATGGALLAGVVTNYYSDSENRAWIGFAVSTAGIVLSESHQMDKGAKRSSSLLDIASHTAGAALGAWWTDRYYLMPVIGRHSAGVVLWHPF
jgi:hypothetical protein